MKKILLILLLIPAWCLAQTGAKPDQPFPRSPNGYNTIVDYQLKVKYGLNIPHYPILSRPTIQDSLASFFLNTTDHHPYIKATAGSTYTELAYFSDIPAALTFTSDFTKTGTLVGFADVLHRTGTSWTIQNTSTTQPALVINSFNAGQLQRFNASNNTVATVNGDGFYYGTGIKNLSGGDLSTILTSTAGTTILRDNADVGQTAVLNVVAKNLLSTGNLLNLNGAGRGMLNIRVNGSISHNPLSVASSGTGRQYMLQGGIKPTADGDILTGFRVSPVFGSSTIASLGSVVGGSGYTNGTFNSLLTGGTGVFAIASVTVSGGAVTAVSATPVDGGINYTIGDVLNIVQLDGSGNPVGSGATVTVVSITSYANVINLAADFVTAPIRLSAITTPTALLDGMVWNNGTHLYGYIGGATRQLDQQGGVGSVFGRNGNVVAQTGDYNTSQVTESGNLYFTATRVLATPATGFSPSAGVISATDPLITVLNKLQGNITAATTGVATFAGRTGTVVPVAGDYASLTESLTNKNLTSGTNTFPTFNQNTTGTAASAAILTTSRTINGVSFNGSANITITANNSNSLLNGFGILGGSYNGGSAITLRADTNAGKLATQWKIDSTANAHGASAGIGINSTLFASQIVGVDTAATIVSKGFLAGYTYTKAQANTAFAEVATANTFLGVNTFSPSVSATSGLARANIYTPTLTQTANNDALVALDVTPTIVPGAFTGATIYGQRYNLGSTVTNQVSGVLIADAATSNTGSLFFGSISGGGFSTPGIWAGTNVTAPSLSNYSFAYGGASSGPIFNAGTGLKISFRINNGAFATLTSNGLFQLTPVEIPLSLSAINSTATATASQVGQGAITSTSAAATTITLPTATQMATQLSATRGFRFSFTVDNTAGANTVTIILGSGMTGLNSPTLTIPASASGVAKFELYFPSTTTATIARIY